MGGRGRDLPDGYAALTSGLRGLVAVVVVGLSSGAAWAQGAVEHEQGQEQGQEQALDVERAFESCRQRLNARDVAAADCYARLAQDSRSSAEDVAVASELADVARDLAPPPVVVEPSASGPQVSVSALVESGAPELVLSSAAWGGVAGFLAAGTVLSATRISEGESLPWLVGAPAFGILAGGAAASAAAYALDLDAGDAALVPSTLWVGTGWGVALQLLLFDQRDDVGHIPLRFATVLGSGLGLGAVGAASAWGLDVEPGDVGLMNSAALWGAVLGGLGWATVAAASGPPSDPGNPLRTLPSLMTTLLASSVLPWGALFALHPFLEIERPATWLIEGGGIAGVLAGLSLVALLSTSSLSGTMTAGMLTTTTALGVAGGSALAFVVSDAVGELDLHDVTGSFLSLAPALLPPAPGRDDLAPGVFATVRF